MKFHRIKPWGAVAGVLALSGCQRPSDLPQKPPPVAAGELPKITVVAGGAESYWNEAKRGALAAGKKFGAQIVWQAPSGANLVKSQQKLVRDAIKNSHGIVLAPLDSTKLMQPVGEAARAGLAVVIFDRDVYTIQNKLSFIHNDDYLAGVLAARAVAKKSAARGTAGVLVPTPDPVVGERVRGFEETLQKEFPNLSSVKLQTPSQLSPVAAVFAPTAEAAPALLSHPPSKSKVVAYGAGDALSAAQRRGQIAALIEPDYYQMSYRSVKAILDYRAVNQPPREIKIAPHIIENKTTNEQK
jgi:ABC-type sugar transport system substrate-binding protein